MGANFRSPKSGYQSQKGLVFSPVSTETRELFESLRKVDSSFLDLNFKDKISFLICGFQSATSKSSNYEIPKFVTCCIKGTGRFDRPFFVQTSDYLIS